ncbi:MAG: Zn-ribbon domain-containing OB-fold protein [Burkholderiales bacterium]
MSATEYKKPLPTLTEENRPFWEGAREGRLVMQKCGACGHIRYPISHVCPDCLSYEFEWTPLSGRGEVFSYVVFYQLYNKAFADDIPYNVALIQLDEGPRMMSNIVGADNDAVKVGDKVEAAFEKATDEITIPKFRLRRT